MYSNTQLSPGRRTSLPVFLVALLLTTLCGCGGDQQELVFKVVDQDKTPLDNVRVFYLDVEKEEVEVGFTTNGLVSVKAEHLSDFSNKTRDFSFEKSSVSEGSRQRYDDGNCSLVTESRLGHYTFRSSDGMITEYDLAKNKNLKKTIEMTFNHYADQDDSGGWQITDTQPCSRLLNITTTPNATVTIGEHFTRSVPSNGLLAADFCPGDSAGCKAENIEIRITKPRYESWLGTQPMPGPGEALRLEMPLTRVPPKNTYAKVRIINNAVPQSCGEVAGEHPVLQINNLTTVISRSPSSDEWETKFDLKLNTGKTYCIAVTCPGTSGNEVRNPWVDANAQTKKPGWFLLKIPAGARNLLVYITMADGNGEVLKVKELGSAGFSDFETEYTFSTGCAY